MTNFEGKYPYLIRHRGDALEGGNPLDTGYVQDGIINTQEMLYGSHGQIRVADLWDTPRVLDLPGASRVLNGEIGWKFPVTIAADGKMTPLFCQIGIKVTGTGVANFTLVLRSLNDGAARNVFTPDTSTGSFEIDSGDEPAWISVTNQLGGDCLWGIPIRTGLASVHTRENFASTTANQLVEYMNARVHLRLDSFDAGITAIHFWGIWIRETPYYNGP